MRLRRLLIPIALVAGCRTWDVRAFNVPLTEKEPRLMAAAEEHDGFSIWAIIAMVAADVAVGIGLHEALN